MKLYYKHSTINNNKNAPRYGKKKYVINMESGLKKAICQNIGKNIIMLQEWNKTLLASCDEKKSKLYNIYPYQST